jgi:polyhydroxyalkanoate synthesis regulator phasin
MNTNNIFSVIQQGFRVTVGATASLVETIQDPQKRNTAFSELTKELNEKTEEWAKKGESTEQEARKMMDEILKKAGKSQNKNDYSSNSPITVDTTAKSSNNDTQSELWKLTQQISALRNELEQLRDSQK